MTPVPVDRYEIDVHNYEALTARAAQSMDPEADLEAMEFGLAILRAGNRLQQDLEKNVHRPAGMTWAAFRVLFTIKSVGSITPTRLAHLSNTSAASISNVLQTLEGYGMIERAAAEADGRSVNVSLTEIGDRAVAELFDRNNERVAEWAQRFTPAERAQLVALLSRLLHAPSPAAPSREERLPPIRRRSSKKRTAPSH